MSKVILNTGKNLEIFSDGGKYKLIAKMKVDYDAISGVFGARDWIFKVIDLTTKQNVNLQTNGVDVFKYRKYQYKKQLIKAIEETKVFSQAINEIKNKNGVRA
jgi:hypothetical protein